MTQVWCGGYNAAGPSARQGVLGAGDGGPSVPTLLEAQCHVLRQGGRLRTALCSFRGVSSVRRDQGPEEVSHPHRERCPSEEHGPGLV